jgi:hypothetical protein
MLMPIIYHHLRIRSLIHRNSGVRFILREAGFGRMPRGLRRLFPRFRTLQVLSSVQVGFLRSALLIACMGLVTEFRAGTRSWQGNISNDLRTLHFGSGSLRDWVQAYQPRFHTLLRWSIPREPLKQSTNIAATWDNP